MALAWRAPVFVSSAMSPVPKLRAWRELNRYPDGSIYEGQWHKDKMWGLGQYDYADGSTYIGKWKEGRKHGPGVYWDKLGACLTGNWEKGILQGEGIYDTEAFQLVAQFRKGIPVGDVLYSLQAYRTKDWRQPACKFILAEHGPTLQHGATRRSCRPFSQAFTGSLKFFRCRWCLRHSPWR